MQTHSLATTTVFPTPTTTSSSSSSCCSKGESTASPSSRLSPSSAVPSARFALTADAALERCRGQAMQSLSLPRPTSILPTPFGRPAEPEDGLAKFRQKFSPTRPELQSYPSPPMSEPHSPARRPAQTVESGRLSYPSTVSAPQRSDAGLPLPPPSSSLFDSRPPLAVQSNFQQRPLYPEPPHRGQSLHYQPGSASEHASYSNVPLPQNYGYGYPSAGLPTYPAAQHGGPMAQQAAMIAPPPARPTKPARRTKAHVASACVNCKKAHLSCDVQRPCGRCVASGKQDSCKDVQHKKRGRPRLRDDREFTRSEEGRQAPNQILGVVSGPETYAHQAPFSSSHSHRTSDPPRMLGGPTQGQDASNADSQTTPSSNGSQSSRAGGFGGALVSPYSSGPKTAYQSLPVAYLNLDLVIQKSNQVFQDLVAFLGNVNGKHLGELLEARQQDNLQRLRNELRDERDEREPTYMAPITPVGQDPMRSVMELVKDQDIDQISQGFTDRPMFLSFRLPGEAQYQSLQVQVRLAKTSLYFVTLVVRSPPRLTAPALLTQQLAPPTPLYKSQTRSAPSTASGSHFAPHQARPTSSTSSAPNSPYFNFSSARTSLPAFSPSSYATSPSYGYSPKAGTEPGHFPISQPTSHPATSYPSPYPPIARNQSVTSAPQQEQSRQTPLQGLHLPPIRTGPAPLGSPLPVSAGSQSVMEQHSNRVRRRDSLSSTDQRRPETPETGKRRRLNIHEVLE